MNNVFIISKKEITRLRSRFTGKSRLIVLFILVLALVTSFIVYRHDLVMGQGLYTIGISPDTPAITDKRFNTIILDRALGMQCIYKKTIDAYVLPDGVIYRTDERSRYATSALKKYLEKEELDRISKEYDIDIAFPLRVEIKELESPEIQLGKGTAGTPSDQSEIGNESAQAGHQFLIPSNDDSEAKPLSASEIVDTSLDNKGDTEAIDQQEFTAPASESLRDDEVKRQLENFKNKGGPPKFQAEFISNEDIIIPSLMTPPTPLAQVILAFLYVVPIFFVSVFFTSSFIEEKINRKLIILLSAPITPFQIILGKMLPYMIYSIIAIIAITLVLKGSIFLGLAIFIPVTLFILAIYLMVALLYRTFKDQTFFSVLAVWVITGYLVAPAMFAGVSDLSYVSPLTLAVQMYKGESFGITEYLLSTVPMYLTFIIAIFLGTRIFNEEFLMGFRSLHTKLGEAVYLAINKKHLNLSVLFLNLAFIPIVFMIQFASIVMASNLPMPYALWSLLLFSVIVEEVAKSTAIIVLLKNNIIHSTKHIVILSFIAALGFLLGEKLLLYIALSVVSESMFTEALFGAGLLIVPLIMHFVATSVVCLSTARIGIKYYPVAIMAGSIIHAIYNLYVIGMIG